MPARERVRPVDFRVVRGAEEARVGGAVDGGGGGRRGRAQLAGAHHGGGGER